LEVFRRHALEVQRLNLVEKLADELKGKNEQLESVLEDLRQAQDQIVMREKLAALGELTAGVAHEIKNPLNFVKNFSEVSEELIDELKEALEDVAEQIPEDDRSYIDEITGDLTGNLQRIQSHGERANRIVHDMLQMGRGSGDLQPTDINGLLDEYARLAYHSARASDSEFQLDILRDLDPEMGDVDVIPQDLGRVFLNMVGNACYATDEKRKAGEVDGYEPTISLKTRRGEEDIEIRIRDNGSGMPPHVVEKIFNPFFTTKPTGEGTGLGLAMSSDIVREHGGSIQVETEPGEFTEMIIELPLEPPLKQAEEGA
ncbi:MAG: ATP-binding protein, partial [Rhodospirillaceae bacterium]|nr:ATP-binding protein [Rhodospirillaceae bacterium]